MQRYAYFLIYRCFLYFIFSSVVFFGPFWLFPGFLFVGWCAFMGGMVIRYGALCLSLESVLRPFVLVFLFGRVSICP